MSRSKARLFTVIRLLLRLGVVATTGTMLILAWMLVTWISAPERVTVSAGPGLGAVVAAPSMTALALVSGLMATALLLPVLGKLLAILSSVTDGDPFTHANGGRLRAIGWLLLSAYIVTLGISLIVFPAPLARLLNMTTLIGLVAVLLFFVVAHVFDIGADMRADLDGTV